MNNKSQNFSKKDREFVSVVSMFLLGREELRKQFWNIKSVNYNHQTQTVNIGISTINGKLGTTLEKLRKTSRHLSDYLYESGLTFKLAKIKFFVDKDEEELLKVQSVIEQIESKQTAQQQTK